MSKYANALLMLKLPFLLFLVKLYKLNHSHWKWQFFAVRSSHHRCSVKKVFLEISQNLKENTCVRVSFLIKILKKILCIKKDTLTQVFSFKFCEISKNIFFTEHLWTTASLPCIFYLIDRYTCRGHPDYLTGNN